MLAAVIAACGPRVGAGEGATTGESSTADPTGDPSTAGSASASSTGPSMTTSASTTGSTTASTSTGDDDPSAGESVSFILPIDGGGCFTHCSECDVWAQDCPRGEKCLPWANDGGMQWNATYCGPLDVDPGEPGDECTVEGGPYSGIDSCEVGSMCWDVDPDTNVGTCVAMCGGSRANPLCGDGEACLIAYNGTVVLCLPTCDPLAPICAGGHACFAENDAFYCVPSGLVAGAYGDPCAQILGCGTGLVCAGIGSTPKCDDECCTALCDLDQPTCPDEELGQLCLPYFREGEAPVGLESVGICDAAG